MSASAYVGRIGVLAAAFGVGAAILTGPAVAWADTTSSDSSSSDSSSANASDASAGPSASSESATTATRSRGNTRAALRSPGSAAEQSGVNSGRGSTDTSSDTSSVDIPDIDVDDAAAVDSPAERATTSARRGNDSSPAQQSADTVPGAAAAAPAPAASTGNSSASSTKAADPVADITPAAAEPAAPAPAPAAATADTLSAVSTVVVADPVTTSDTAEKAAPVQSVTSTASTAPITLSTAIASVADKVTTLIDSVVARLVNTFSSSSPFGPQVESPANWLLLAAARRQPLAAAATTANAVTNPATPTLVLDGYNIVAASTAIIEQFTGRWAYWPGQPNMLQGRQDFNIVDPTSKEILGSFSALVTSGDPTSIGARYVEMLVTANDGVNVGTGAGQTPPVGSLISEFSLGGFGFSYASMPSESGDKVSVKIKTPFMSIPIPLTYDASEGIADHTFDNRPMYLTNGYSIKPADPDAETITGAIGFLPLFNSIQGVQEFGVFDSEGNQVGSFTGNFTTTSDTLGISTQAIQVIANDGINVGTGAGQTPPVGTVYNVAYFWGDENFLIYSSMPQGPDKSDIMLKFSSNSKVTDLENLPLTLASFSKFDASHEPAMKSLTAPGGQKFVATSEIIPVGVNGLPPRDVQIQGYQQYDVYDFLGRKIGTVDAQVENQWDAFGVHSQSILITEVTSGTAGSSPLQVPAVGTVMNFVDSGAGIGFSDSVTPLTPNINLNSWQLVTPFFNIPLLPSILLNFQPAVDYYDPFV